MESGRSFAYVFEQLQELRVGADSGNDDAFGELTYRDGCILGLALLPVMFLFDWLADEGVSNAATSSLAVLVLIVALFYPLTRHLWFWIVWFLLVLAHAAFIVLIPWPNDVLSGTELKGLMGIHLAVVVGLIWSISKVMAHLKR